MTNTNVAENATPSARLRVFALEALKLLSIAIASLVVIAIVVVVSAKTGIVIPARWCGLFFWTCALLWIVCRQHKHHLRQGKFWVALLGLMSVHLAIFVPVLRAYPEWREALFPFAFVIEGTVILAALDKVLRHRRQQTTANCSQVDVHQP